MCEGPTAGCKLLSFSPRPPRHMPFLHRRHRRLTSSVSVVIRTRRRYNHNHPTLHAPPRSASPLTCSRQPQLWITFIGRRHSNRPFSRAASREVWPMPLPRSSTTSLTMMSTTMSRRQAQQITVFDHDQTV